MRDGMKYYKTHKFMEHGRCWNCSIKPGYLMDWIHAYEEGNITEEQLRAISKCHEKIIVGVEESEVK